MWWPEMPFVLHPTIALRWAFGERGETPLAAEALSRLLDDHVVVPAVWPYDVARALGSYAARGIASPAHVLRALALLRELPIIVDTPDLAAIFGAEREFAHIFDLDPHSATYLFLALRLGIPIATLDGAMQRHARRAEILVLGDVSPTGEDVNGKRSPGRVRERAG